MQDSNNKDLRQLIKAATLAVMLLAVFLLFTSVNAFRTWRQPLPALSTIAVSGTGEAFATPDIATFSYSVSADAATVGDAQGTVTSKSNKILDALKGMRIDEKDIKTTDYSVYPKYKYVNTPCPANSYCPPGRQVADGYTVTNSVTVKVRKTADAGKALSAAGDNGATNISGLSFTLDDPDAIQAQARDKAVSDAKAKADILAKSLGVSLGRVVDFSDSSNPTPYPIYAMASGMGGADAKSVPPTLPTGQNKYTSNVTITYEIR